MKNLSDADTVRRSTLYPYACVLFGAAIGVTYTIVTTLHDLLNGCFGADADTYFCNFFPNVFNLPALFLGAPFLNGHSNSSEFFVGLIIINVLLFGVGNLIATRFLKRESLIAIILVNVALCVLNVSPIFFLIIGFQFFSS